MHHPGKLSGVQSDCQKNLQYRRALFQGYEFIGIKGLTGKMSGSSGLNINLEELLKIYPPEIIWWLYARKTPNEAFDISLGDDVPRIYGNLTDFVKTITITRKSG